MFQSFAKMFLPLEVWFIVFGYLNDVLDLVSLLVTSKENFYNTNGYIQSTQNILTQLIKTARTNEIKFSKTPTKSLIYYDNKSCFVHKFYQGSHYFEYNPMMKDCTMLIQVSATSKLNVWLPTYFHYSNVIPSSMSNVSHYYATLKTKTKQGSLIIATNTSIKCHVFASKQYHFVYHKKLNECHYFFISNDFEEIYQTFHYFKYCTSSDKLTYLTSFYDVFAYFDNPFDVLFKNSPVLYSVFHQEGVCGELDPTILYLVTTKKDEMPFRQFVDNIALFLENKTKNDFDVLDKSHLGITSFTKTERFVD